MGSDTNHTTFHLDGYRLLRLLSERERSKLFLAMNKEGRWCAVKFQQPKDPLALPGLAQRDALLQALTRESGLLEVLDHGQINGSWAWKALALADALPTLPSLEVDGGVDQYAPLTLQAWRLAYGSPSARQVLQWGIRLGDALGTLHNAGLVHRDIKPANILFVGGQPCVGDYELSGRPGELIDYRGTEGYLPVEGTNDPGADLFGLGKTLYEVWTGANRLEFPSLPRTILDAAEWNEEGSRLNEVICRACNAQPRKRFRSAREISAAFADVGNSDHPWGRRRWLTVAAGGAAIAFVGTLTRRLGRPPARAVWQSLREAPFFVEYWQGNYWSADWIRRKIYSFTLGRGVGNLVFQTLDLQTLEVVSRELPRGSIVDDASFIVHPETRELWILEGGDGRVFSLHTDTLELRHLGGGPHDRRHYSTYTYWNPVSRRVGIWGGYGMNRVTNSQCEFDERTGKWIRLLEDGVSGTPCRRELRRPLIPDPSGRRLFLIGGEGSPSGTQGERNPGLPGFNGRFHDIDDIWELDLQANRWTRLLASARLDTFKLSAAAFSPQLNGLVLFGANQLHGENDTQSSVWLFRPGIDRRPVPIPSVGKVLNLSTVMTYALDPGTQELLFCSGGGIFKVGIDRS